MPYIGNSPATGENNSFKILDDIKTYTLTFDGSSASVVSVGDDTITSNNHRFITAQRVTYTDGTGTAIGGLTDGTVYYIIKNDQNTIKLATSQANANAGTAINLTALGTGTNHTLNVAFDSVNTKFKATYDNGTKALVTRAAQLTLSVNGVIQEPQDTTTPTNGFGIDTDGVIIFSVAPVNTDTFWGNLVANNFPTFDISDNTIDNFVGTGSTTVFILSKAPANNQNILVTLDGVVQYPSDATTTRSYSVTGNTLTFDTAPGNGVDIQVRHIGFAGATSSAVTGFYGRTGNVGLTTADNVVVNNIFVGSATSTGTASQRLQVTGGGYVSGNLGIGTTNPTHKLEVSGDVKVSGFVTASEFRKTEGTINQVLMANGSVKAHPASGAQWNTIPLIGGDGVMEIGRYIDFHSTNADTSDNTYRFDNTSNGNMSFSGNLSVNGSLSKGSGSFKIDHPLEELSETRHLVHSFIEGPKADLIYRGKTTLISGISTINIDEVSNMTNGTFTTLCREVQCFTTNESGWTAIKGSVTGNLLTVQAQDLNCTDTISWMVIGERKDKHMYETEWTDENGKVIVEPLK